MRTCKKAAGALLAFLTLGGWGDSEQAAIGKGAAAYASTKGFCFTTASAWMGPAPGLGVECGGKSCKYNEGQSPTACCAALEHAKILRWHPNYGTFLSILTPEGEKYQTCRGGSCLLCIGRQELSRVTTYTKPAPSPFGGFLMTRVQYVARVVDLPDWAKSDAVKAAFPDLRAIVDSGAPVQDTVDLIETNRGWVDPATMR